jgi:deoxyribodipyrimidine photolyase-related protein
MKRINRLVIILGDQLNYEDPLFNKISKDNDCIWMAEVAEEATKVWSHKARITVFLAAMRHFAAWLKTKQYRLHYTQLQDPNNTGSLTTELTRAIKQLNPKEVLMIEPDEWQVREQLISVCEKLGVSYSIEADSHFLCSTQEFAAYADRARVLRMEFFYRKMRIRYKILMDGHQPVGRKWNYDSENRKKITEEQLKKIPKSLQLTQTIITKDVIKLVNKRFAKHPGDLANFNWPVTPAQARLVLRHFIKHRLALFGPYQDTMCSNQPFIYHSQLSSALNLKLISPLMVIKYAEKAYQEKKAPLNSVEGFIRQILGWREYIRGTYWYFMPNYFTWNYFAAKQPLPNFYWTAKTEMNCLKEVIQQTLQYGYAHHIQRLMVTGLFALLLGVEPKAIHEWYLAIYVDAVEWVELPNTLGMSQFIDGGKLASKPYIASGKYIQKMSHYCQNCRFNPAKSIGEDACPFTTLYWNFLFTHQKKLRKNPRMQLQLNNLKRLKDTELSAIKAQAKEIRQKFVV